MTLSPAQSPSETVEKWLVAVVSPEKIALTAWPLMTRSLRLAVVQGWLFQTRQERHDADVHALADSSVDGDRWLDFSDW